MTFTYDNKEFSFTNTLDFEEVHENLLTEAISQYNRKTLTAYVEAGDMVKLPVELGASLLLTAYNLHSFVTSIMKLSESGWELTAKNYCTSYGKFSYSVTLVRSPDFMKADGESIATSIPEKVEQYIRDFEATKATARMEYETSIRGELKELNSLDAKKRKLYRQLEQIKGVA